MPDTTSFEIRIHDSERGFWDWRLDTIQVINGKGVLTDISAVHYPVKAFALTPYGDIPFYVANGVEERISGSVADIDNINLSFDGAPWSHDMMVYNNRIEAPTMRLHSKMSEWQNLTKEQRDSIKSELALIDKIRNDTYLEYPNSWLTLFDITSVLSDYPRDVLERIYAQLTPDRLESEYGQTLGRYLALKQISEGDRLLDYDIQVADQFGRQFKLSDVKEPYIVLDFSQCYCGPCVQATKEIAQLREKYAGKIAFVNYSCDELEEQWRKAVKRDSIEWPSIFDATGPSGTVCLQYNVSSYPSFFIYGPDRKLITKWSGYGPGAIESMLPKEAKE